MLDKEERLAMGSRNFFMQWDHHNKIKFYKGAGGEIFILWRRLWEFSWNVDLFSNVWCHIPCPGLEPLPWTCLGLTVKPGKWPWKYSGYCVCSSVWAIQGYDWEFSMDPQVRVGASSFLNPFLAEDSFHVFPNSPHPFGYYPNIKSSPSSWYPRVFFSF